MFRTLVLLAVLMIAACQAPLHRPSFLTRSIEDCTNGDEAACSMLHALAADGDQTGNAEPDSAAGQQLEQNVDAIMSGIERAKSTPPAKRWQISPSGVSVQP